MRARNPRRSRAIAIASGVLAFLAATVSGGGTAAAGAACASGTFCIYRQADYCCTAFQITPAPSGTCQTLSTSYWSYINKRSIEGYFYSTTNCTAGSVRAVNHGSQANIGFGARSFKHACVSCRTAHGSG
ncbi:hypothetical protein E1292_24450 [Nonomuraea deserti]|uniref:Uncharacterized protein n=1 Tax=Nonomuraea deserti TaxID=1848322 RepID=A0A4R4VAD4_9ACTN|nr:hypothetical protein [Nonomuraea deserti]TDD02062.1 hypothetical protein E1292_24450 [Nonomuraea deserti]